MMTGLFTVLCFITTASSVPDWVVSGDAADLQAIEQELETVHDAVAIRVTAPDGSVRLRVRLPGERQLREIASFLVELLRRHIQVKILATRPAYCPYGAADRWREGTAGPPTVGIFGSAAQIERVRAANPNWQYEPARLDDGRTGVHFIPGADEQDSYAEFMSQAHAEFGAIDIAVIEQVYE